MTAAGTLVACSSDSENGTGVGQSGGDGTGDGTTSGDDDNLFGDSVTGGDGDGDGTSGDGDGSQGDFDVLNQCAGENAEAERVPAVLQLVIDTSGSMGQAPDGGDRGPSKWDLSHDALSEAIAAMPAGTALGAVFFPDIQHSDNGPCFAEDVAVPIARLGASGSEHRSLIEDALDGVQPQGGTPTHDALSFALDGLQQTELFGNPFLILITDGNPTYSQGCDGTGLIRDPVDPAPVVSAVGEAFSSGVGTFIVGSPGSDRDGYEGRDPRIALSEMAQAGGTAVDGCDPEGPNYCHFDMTQEADFGAALTDALLEISGRVLSCEYDIPDPPSGLTLNLDQVNVVFTPDQGEAELIAQGAEGEPCDEGWQYSSDATRVTLCESTCSRAKAEVGGTIELKFGCDTQVSVR